ncbi:MULTISPECIES: ABC transporter permease [unclassified Herbaspirillum]|uniref:ABC transporter permease n=1 Tax=unclassified Herbaspirillum TaxID=2624150 RepID=UPI000E2EAC1C|nr:MULTISPECIES: ABC transporter permease [unclassified Herbaspirillum]RFB67959.1 ABC transporter permease [Herbaspirillum sp. 3R-3a1]TFI06398.1 ABC transporter permease [Herbaspirillum sp. 3R11]TFI13990.1 ABC transporter permease [Herbaspirillum sp. 3R-11]TFI21817.1 ABC transporter permease [Herbaspirillum sp. 3C11]
MPAFLLRRIGSALVTLLLMSVLIFVMVRMVGDPAHLMMPPEATEADRALFREQLGLNDPVPVQYARFLSTIVRGDFGNSFHFGVPALSIVEDRLGPSLLLTLSALAFAIFIGVPLGIAAAVKKDGFADQFSKIFAALGQAAPPFFFALLFIRLFSVGLGWLPTGGYGSWQHLVLPVIALGWYSAAGLCRLTQANLTAVLQSEYVKMARIKGVPEHVVVLKHALKNAALPVITFAASQFGILIGGAVSIEAVFSWPGFGSLMVESINQLDFTVVQAAVIVSTLLFIVINFTVDLLYALIDPRISHV